MTDTTNHATIGGNNPPEDMLLRADELLRLFDVRYAGLSADVTQLLAEVREGSPTTIETEQQDGIVAAFMERLRNTIKDADTRRVGEKAPYLTAERAIDNFFNGMIDRLDKARNILQARGNDYARRKVAMERAKRQREAEEAARAARIAADKAAAEAKAAAELEAAAARARKPENIEKLEQAADQKRGNAAMAAVDKMIADSEAENAALATMARSADLARTRHETGHLSTAKQVPHVEIVDDAMLDTKALWPFIRADVKLAALKAWAKTYNHEKQMPGALIEMRDAAVYR